MNQLSLEKKAQIITCLVEGNSIRRLVVWLVLQKEQWRDCLRVLARFVLSTRTKCFVTFTAQTFWVALDADTKLVPSWCIGLRSAEYAYRFILDLEARLKNRVQLTTDGHKAYLKAIESVFGTDIDYAMLVKLYGLEKERERRYSPAQCVGTELVVIEGKQEKEKISTSYVERQNLTMRMSMRRFTRLTNAFSKKIENLETVVALHFMYYNFCRPHKSLNKKRSLGITPAIAAGVTDHQWTVLEILGLVDWHGIKNGL